MKPQSAKAKNYTHAISAANYILQRMQISLSGEGCWEWRGPLDKDGYGQVHCSKYGKLLKVSRAHQMSYVVFNGDYDRKLWILHKCNNPSCCNPRHLYAGTALENNRDMTRAGRQYYPCGEDSSNAKLKVNEVKTIRALKGKKTCHELAAEYNVSFGHICRIWRGERYANC